MYKSIMETQKEFESSSVKTPEYLSWFRLFKKEFTELLNKRFCIEKQDILIGKPNHFDMSGFFKYLNQWIYFSISDLRWCKDEMLIRTANHEKDYSGGTNFFITLSDADKFISGLDGFITQIKRNQGKGVKDV